MFSVFAIVTACTLAVADQYTVTADSIGIGNRWCGGFVTPIRVSVRSTSVNATQAWVQWEVPDADGDTVFWGKPITITPGTTSSAWLYAPVQPWADNSQPWTIRLRNWDGNKPTDELTSTRFTSNSINSSTFFNNQGLIAVVGTRRMGLEHYLPISPPDPKQEASIIVSGLTSKDLPDSWPSYDSLDALVWADSPPSLSIKQETAIENWIERGGHLVISLPTIGDPWSIGHENGPLSNLLQGVNTSVVDIPIAQLDGVLGRKNSRWSFNSITARSLMANSNYSPILQLKNGTVIGIQKNFGFGTVTVIGIDLSSGLLSSIGLPETHILWRKVFAKRGDIPTQNIVSALSEDDQLSSGTPTVTTVPLGEMVAQEIAMSSTAGGRLGTVFLLIVSFWVMSGPVSFFVLRNRKRLRWAWVIFAGVSAVFSLLAWVLATTTSGVLTPIKHVSIIDHVYGESGQRVIGWYSLFLPTYGRSRVALEGEEGNLLLPWSSPDALLTPPFVDNREIIANLSHVPSTFDQPSRATTANFAYEWIGGINNSFYSSLIRIDPNDQPRNSKPSRRRNEVGALQGKIINHATNPIHDVTIIWVTDVAQPLPPLGKYQDTREAPWNALSHSGSTLQKTYSWRLAHWDDGDVINLTTLEPARVAEFDAANQRYEPDNSVGFLGRRRTDKINWRKELEILSIYSNLKPPIYMKSAKSKQSDPQFKISRKDGHELDLAQWFGRPCIIVMGFIPNSPIPVKISVDGDEITESTGETFVRWVYPLGDSK